MAHAYTPGLKVTPVTLVRKERKLPLPGEILVQVGDHVQATDVVARAELPGNVQLVNIGSALSIPPEDIHRHMLKKTGDLVSKGEVIATTKGLFGLFKSQAQAPTDGTIESISEITGQVIIREAPIPVELQAYIVGEVAEVIPEEGVVVETYATFVQGIFGIGGENVGKLKVLAQHPEQVLSPEAIDASHRDQVLVVGALASAQLIDRAIQMGVKGLVAGGIHDADLRQILGYELGVAITGTETIGLTLIITEGFGQIAIAQRTFELFLQREGMQASINGATQIRAGVVRPEVIIPLDTQVPPETEEKRETAMEVGAPVRVIRDPYFGRLGTVVDLPIDLQELETEAKVRVVDVRLDDGEVIRLPRANVELIEQ